MNDNMEEKIHEQVRKAFESNDPKRIQELIKSIQGLDTLCKKGVSLACKAKNIAQTYYNIYRRRYYQRKYSHRQYYHEARYVDKSSKSPEIRKDKDKATQGGGSVSWKEIHISDKGFKNINILKYLDYSNSYINYVTMTSNGKYKKVIGKVPIGTRLSDLGNRVRIDLESTAPLQVGQSCYPSGKLFFHFNFKQPTVVRIEIRRYNCILNIQISRCLKNLNNEYFRKLFGSPYPTFLTDILTYWKDGYLYILLPPEEVTIEFTITARSPYHSERFAKGWFDIYKVAQIKEIDLNIDAVIKDVPLTYTRIDDTTLIVDSPEVQSHYKDYKYYVEFKVHYKRARGYYSYWLRKLIIYGYYERTYTKTARAESLPAQISYRSFMGSPLIPVSVSTTGKFVGIKLVAKDKPVPVRTPTPTPTPTSPPSTPPLVSVPQTPTTPTEKPSLLPLLGIAGAGAGLALLYLLTTSYE